MYEWLSLGWSAGFKHLQHAVGDQKSADDVASGSNYGDKAENKSQTAFMFADQNDRAQYRDSIQRVGQRHEWRVQKRRYAPDHFQADKGCQDEDEESVYELELHICCLGRARLQPCPTEILFPLSFRAVRSRRQDARNLLFLVPPLRGWLIPAHLPSARAPGGNLAPLRGFCRQPYLLRSRFSTEALSDPTALSSSISPASRAQAAGKIRVRAGSQFRRRESPTSRG